MANTPEVDDWLAKTNQLTVAAIAIAGQQWTDEDTMSMMRQVRASATVLIQALGHLPPPAPPAPPPAPPPPEE